MSGRHQTWTAEELKKLMSQTEMETRKEIAEVYGLDKALAKCMAILKDRFSILGTDLEKDYLIPAAEIGELVETFELAIRDTMDTLELKELARRAQAVMDGGHKFLTICFKGTIFSRTADGVALVQCCCGSSQQPDNDGII